MNEYSPREYWTSVVENFRSADGAGFAPVLHPGAPAWFNETIDALQWRAVARALEIAALPKGGRILDVGCGTGRWLRRYQSVGYRPTGVDATVGMLSLARQHGTNASLASGEAQRLPFSSAVFDCVSDITVVQHLPTTAQPLAITEMLRVLKPGGKLILMELIRGKGAHIFPRTPEDWTEQVSAQGAKLIGWFGQEFLLLDRIFTATARLLRRKNGNGDRETIRGAESATAEVSATRRAYWYLRRVIVPVSAWTDPVAEKVCPKFATHGVFIFSK